MKTMAINPALFLAQPVRQQAAFIAAISVCSHSRKTLTLPISSLPSGHTKYIARRVSHCDVEEFDKASLFQIVGNN